MLGQDRDAAHINAKTGTYAGAPLQRTTKRPGVNTPTGSAASVKMSNDSALVRRPGGELLAAG